VKYDPDTLEPLSDGSNDSNNDGITFGTRGPDSSTGTNAGNNSGSGASGTTGNAPDGGTTRSADGDSGELPLGTARATRDADPYRNGGSRRGRTGRNSGDSGTAKPAGSARTTAEKGPQSPSENPPRAVKLSELGGKTDKKTEILTKEFLAEGFVLAFDSVGFFVQDKETWHIERDEDAAELADRTLTWVRSLDKAKSAKWEKIVAKWQPLLFLLMGIAMVVWPRLSVTLSKKRRGNPVSIPPKGTATAGNGKPAAPVAPPASNASATATEAPVRHVVNGEHGHGNAELRPLRSKDFFELFGQAPP
jgi:hypothetical protein